ncbi:hypothetical protein B0H14DRAFT_3427248 [Mycena olivaceomarginata]|nr:hypothetical protein B0H14DRAFT_3427248 [Mycena olivaceomarginata]
METPLATLGRMASPNIHGLVATSDDIHELDLFGYLVASMRHISFLVFQRISTVAGHICLEDALGTAKHLRGLSILPVLEFRGFEMDGGDEGGV